MKPLTILSLLLMVIFLTALVGCKKETSSLNNPPPTPPPPPPSSYKAPVANAGPDQTITILSQLTTATLNGSASYDSIGTPLQYFWRQIAGPANSSLSTTGQKECGVFGINTPGVYSFELKVWNNNGNDFDTTDVTVQYPVYCQSNRPELPVSLTFLSNLPGHIQDPEIIAAGNKLIIPAWFNNATATISNSVYLYDRVSQNWTTIHASLARIGVATVAAGGKVFFAGGVDHWDDSYNATPVVDIYDLATNTWSVTNLSEARGYCKAVVSGSKIFFAGGLKSNYVLSGKVDIYDLETGAWSSTSLPGGARAVGAALNVQGKLLFCGGYSRYEDPTGWGNTFTTPTSSIDIYNTNSGQWSAGTMQVSRGSFASISVNEKVFFAGGIVNNAASFHVEELNVNTMSSSGSCLHQPMVSHNDKGAAIKNDMVLFFTYTPFTGVVRNRFDLYNIQTGLWSVGVLPPDLIPAGMSSAIESVNNEVYAVIGDKLYKINL